MVKDHSGTGFVLGFRVVQSSGSFTVPSCSWFLAVDLIWSTDHDFICDVVECGTSAETWKEKRLVWFGWILPTAYDRVKDYVTSSKKQSTIVSVAVTRQHLMGKDGVPITEALLPKCSNHWRQRRNPQHFRRCKKHKRVVMMCLFNDRPQPTPAQPGPDQHQLPATLRCYCKDLVFRSGPRPPSALSCDVDLSDLPASSLPRLLLPS